MSKALEALEKLYKRLLYLSNLINHNKTTSELGINSVTHYLTIKQALERNVPKKPIEVEKKHFDCGNCGETISVGNSKKFNEFFNVHCVFCGQEQDWSVEDEGGMNE